MTNTRNFEKVGFYHKSRIFPKSLIPTFSLSKFQKTGPPQESYESSEKPDSGFCSVSCADCRDGIYF